MARIRSIKPEFWADEKMARELPRDARLFYVALWNEADDQGRFIANARKLLGAVFPYDEDVHEQFIETSLRALAATRRIVLYEVEGCRYGQLTKFAEHQRINRPTPSKLPAPPLDNRPLTEPSVSDAGGLTEGSHPSRAPEEQGTGSREQGAGSRESRDLRDDLFGSLDRYAVDSIKGLYGWDGSEGTDEVVWGDAADDPELRKKCLRIAIQRLEGEGRAYQGRWFRRILEAVIEEQATGHVETSRATGFVSYDADYEPGGIYGPPADA